MMPAIAYTGASPRTIEQLQVAFPDTELLHVPLGRAHQLATEVPLRALVVDEQSVRDAGRRLAMLKAGHPALAVVALLPLSTELWQLTFELGAAHVDTLVIAGMEDHPDRLRDALGRAALCTVARVIEYACHPFPPPLVAANLGPALRRVGEIRYPTRLASALHVPLPALRDQLKTARLAAPRTLLAWFACWRPPAGSAIRARAPSGSAWRWATPRDRRSATRATSSRVRRPARFAIAAAWGSRASDSRMR